MCIHSHLSVASWMTATDVLLYLYPCKLWQLWSQA
jgi:hypothetical protein